MLKALYRLSFLILIAISTALTQTAEEAINLLEDEQGVGIKATSMGNAFTAVADDYTAIYWNPAGLAQLKKGEINAGLSNLRYNSTTDFSGSSLGESQNYTKLHNIGFAYPFPVMRGSFVVAFGYQRTKDLDNIVSFAGYNESSNGLGFEIDNDRGYYGVLPFDLGLDQAQKVNNIGAISQWSAAAAIDLSPEFSAGLTMNFYGGHSEYNMAYSQDDTYGNNSYDVYDEKDRLIEYFYYNYYDVHQRIESDFSGFEMKAGMLYRVLPFFQVGATITFPMSLKITENWSVDDELSYDIYSIDEDLITEYYDAANLGSGEFDYLIEVPYKFTVGAALKNSLFTVSGSAEYRDWTQMKFAMPSDRDAADYQDLLSHNARFREDFRETVNLSAGAELNIFKASLRAGVRYVQSPFKQDIFGDLDKYYLSAGGGLTVSENMIIEASYTIGLWDKNLNYNYDWEAPESMSVSENHTSKRMLVGLRIFY